MPYNKKRDDGAASRPSHEGSEPATPGLFKGLFRHSAEEDKPEERTGFPFQCAESRLREEQEENSERERMRALGVPDWVIERKIIDNRHDLAMAKKVLDEDELREVEKSWKDGDERMSYSERQELRKDAEIRASQEDWMLMNQGKTPREIVQIKSARLLQKKEEQLQHY
ncbi:MAG: hypothetical protein Q9174_005798 [Haloplaca sp. 1 TL-2023]